MSISIIWQNQLVASACERQDKEQIQNTKSKGKFTAYISGDGKHITNWPGRILGDVVSLRKLNDSNKYGEHYYRLTAKLFDGSIWTCRCLGNGMYCNLTKK